MAASRLALYAPLTVLTHYIYIVKQKLFKFTLVHNSKFLKERYTILNKSPKFA